MNFLISFVFVFQRRKTNDIGDKHEFYVLWLQQLLALKEERVRSLAILEQEQQRRKAFVNRHQGQTEKMFGVGRVVLVFQTRIGKMPGKLCFRWTGPDWIIAAENDIFTLATLAREILPQKVTVFRLKPYAGPTAPNPFGNLTDPTPRRVGPLLLESSSDEEPTT